jgi:xylulokinase
LPIATTEVFESVAVGAAKQAAWALTGTMPEWSVPYVSEQEPTEADVSAAAEIGERYRLTLMSHYGVAAAGGN